MSKLRFTDNGVLRFTDGSFLSLGLKIDTIPGTGEDYIYKSKISGYNPATDEWEGEKFPLFICVKDSNNQKIAGFTGVKTDVRGYTWDFELYGLTISYNEQVIFSYTLPNNANAYTLIYDPTDHLYKIAVFNFPHYEDSSASKTFQGVNGIAGGGVAPTVYNDYFKDAQTFFDAGASRGFFIDIVSNNENDFISRPYVLACHIGYQSQPNVSTWTDYISLPAINADLPEPELNPEDPYQPGGSTTPGGGDGSFNKSSDPINMPSIPSLAVINTGFVSLWRPSDTELVALHSYLWSGAFDPDSLKKIFANPIDAIMGFGIIPLNPVIGSPRSLKIGNIDTGVNITPITQQYYQVDCGTLYLENYFNTYLEFEPYSTLEIFLPFCGCMQLSADDFYRRKKEYPGGGAIQVKYNVDILSGSCVACIRCYDANGHMTTTYEFNGNLLTQIPITGNDFSGLYNAVLGIAGNVVSGVAHAATGNAAGILGDVVNAAHNVTSAKPSINRSGTIGGSYGLLANRKPFLIRNIPREAVAWAQNTFQGYPSHITTAINSISGYTEFEKVYTDNIPASDNELKEIVQILETGVIL